MGQLTARRRCPSVFSNSREICGRCEEFLLPKQRYASVGFCPITTKHGYYYHLISTTQKRISKMLLPCRTRVGVNYIVITGLAGDQHAFIALPRPHNMKGCCVQNKTWWLLIRLSLLITTTKSNQRVIILTYHVS